MIPFINRRTSSAFLQTMLPTSTGATILAPGLAAPGRDGRCPGHRTHHAVPVTASLFENRMQSLQRGNLGVPVKVHATREQGGRRLDHFLLLLSLRRRLSYGRIGKPGLGLRFDHRPNGSRRAQRIRRHVSVERGTSLSADGNDAGRYLIRFIEPGLYNISVEAAGLKRFVRESVRLDTAQKARARRGALSADIVCYQYPAQ